jgi:hypothetical protein
MIAARLIAPLLLAGAVACAGGGNGDAVAKRSIDDVIAAHTDSLMALPGVVGTALGLCDGEQCIKKSCSPIPPRRREAGSPPAWKAIGS